LLDGLNKFQVIQDKFAELVCIPEVKRWQIFPPWDYFLEVLNCQECWIIRCQIKGILLYFDSRTFLRIQESGVKCNVMGYCTVHVQIKML
jgi:hypothetical protein